MFFDILMCALFIFFFLQVLLYDLRANKPFLVKDHALGLPVKNIEFIESEELVASLDPKCVKFWKQNTVSISYRIYLF